MFPYVIITLTQIGCLSVQETGAGGMPNAKLVIPRAASFTAATNAQCWKGTAPAAIKGIRRASLRDLRLATTLILMVLTTSLRGLRLAITPRPRGLVTTLIIMVLTLPKLARLVPVGG